MGWWCGVWCPPLVWMLVATALMVCQPVSIFATFWCKVGLALVWLGVGCGVHWCGVLVWGVGGVVWGVGVGCVGVGWWGVGCWCGVLVWGVGVGCWCGVLGTCGHYALL